MSKYSTRPTFASAITRNILEYVYQCHCQDFGSPGSLSDGFAIQDKHFERAPCYAHRKCTANKFNGLTKSIVHADSGKPYQESAQEQFRIQIPKSTD
jgi:hypothetical protein